MFVRLLAGLLLLLIGSAVPVASQDQPAVVPPHQQLRELVESYYDEFLLLNPFLATFNGDHRFNDLFAIGISPEHRKRSLSLERLYLERAANLDRSRLDAVDSLTLDLFLYRRREAVEAFEFPDHLLPVNQFFSMPQVLPMMGTGDSFQPFDTVRDYENWLKRLAGWGPWVHQAIVNMREGMNQGIVQPRVIVQRLLPLVAVHVVENPRESVFYKPMEKMPAGVSESERQRLERLYIRAIRDEVVPHYQRLRDFMQDEYLPATRKTVGFASLPGGEKWYAFQVRAQTTSGLTPAEIHRIGLDEVERIAGEIKRAVQRDDLPVAPPLPSYSSEEEMLDGYRNLRRQVEANLPKLFRQAPMADFEIRAVELFRQETQAGASYMAAAPDGSRPGIFYVNTRNWRGAGRASEALFLHEAIPGHHFQISLQQELGELPRFRRFGRFTAYSEGWALYVERLGPDLGLYKTREQYIRALRSEMFRARRLVVDTGLHAMNWTREKAIDYIGSRNEVDRYIVLPGQALAYKIGQMRILELRERAKQSLGDGFDIRDFHHEILRDGALPLELLESKLATWIASREELASPEFALSAGEHTSMQVEAATNHLQVGALPVSAVAVSGADASAQDPKLGGRTGSTVKFRITEHDLYPESIAFDPVSGDYFLSSMGRSRILRIHRDGSFEDFLPVEVPELASSIGMKVDAIRRSLWVCTGRATMLADFDTTPPRTGVLQFNIDTGKLVRSWMLEQEQDSPYHIFNDIALTASGEAFATTTLLGRIYKITPGSETLTLVHQLDAESHNNGIVLGPDEKYLFITVDRKIHRMELASGEIVPLAIPDDEDLGTDGLYYHDGSLILVKPRFKKVSRIFLDDDLMTVNRVETLVDNHPDLAYPTTGVLVGNALVFVATSFADSPRSDEPGPQHPDVLIHQVPLK